MSRARPDSDERRGSPARPDRPGSASSKKAVKPSALTAKFDPATEGSFRTFNIKLRSYCKWYELDGALSISDASLASFVSKGKDDWDESDTEMAEMCNTLYFMIINAIDVSSTEGEDLLSLLSDKYDRDQNADKFDNGAAAYKELVKTYGGVTKVSTMAIINGLKDMKLQGCTQNEIAQYESLLSRTFKKLEQAGEPLSQGQQKAYLLNGLGDEWESFIIDVQKEDLKEGSAVTYKSVLKQFKELAPTIEERAKSKLSSEAVYFVKGGKTRQSRPAESDVDDGDKKPCWRCGGKWKPYGHTADKCPGKNKSCTNCG